MFSKDIYKYLETALDYGLKEFEFWDMTFAELTRYFESRKRVEEKRLQEKASFDYIQAQLITRGISCLFSSSAQMPKVYEVYPTLFEAEIIKQNEANKRVELSAARFKQFAETHNKKFNRGEQKNE